MVYFAASRRYASKSVLITTMMVMAMLLLSACNGDPQAQQRATAQKSHLDGLLAQARNIGVPGTLLQPIMKQERQISSTSAPLTVLYEQPANDYFNNLAQRYQVLALEVSGLETRVTQEFDYQAYHDIQDFENALAQRQAQNFVETRTFANQLALDQALLAKAQYPKEYLQISSGARRSTQALRLMGPAYSKLLSLDQVTQQLQASRVDAAGLVQGAKDDLELFRKASTPEDFVHLTDQISTQLQVATLLSIQAIPYVGTYEGNMKLQQLKAAIDQAQKYGQDVTTFQQHFTTEQTELTAAQPDEYSKILSQIDADIAAIQIPLIRGKAYSALKQFKQEVHVWGNNHHYMDQYDNQPYRLDYEYDSQGIGSDADVVVQAARTVDEYQAAITLINNDLFHLKAMEADYGDQTSWDQPHAADLRLMRYYNLNGVDAGSVIVVSLVEQSLRFYQGGKFVRALQITSGQYERPSPPGLWNIFLRRSPTEFKSTEPPGSAFWYPPTKIEYAMEYHEGGYFLHDSWWRADYGAGTNFPHYDSGGDETYAGNGSHGCINLAPDDAAWIYQHTGYGTAVIVY